MACIRFDVRQSEESQTLGRNNREKGTAGSLHVGKEEVFDNLSISIGLRLVARLKQARKIDECQVGLDGIKNFNLQQIIAKGLYVAIQSHPKLIKLNDVVRELEKFLFLAFRLINSWYDSNSRNCCRTSTKDEFGCESSAQVVLGRKADSAHSFQDRALA